MLLIYETIGTSNFMTLYRDSDDPKLFYFAPKFAALSTYPNGKLKFGSRVFKRDPKNPNDGFGVVNFTVSAVLPAAELAKARKDLEQTYGPNVRIAAITPNTAAPSLKPLTDGIYNGIKCQSTGIDLFTDLACSFTFPEIDAADFKGLLQTSGGWAGEIDFMVRTQKTAFDWKITANWHRIQEHFRSQVSVKYWFVSANLSYETKRLIETDVLKIDIAGGTPSQREKVYAFAEKIAARLFVPTLSPEPLPGHPSGSAVCFSLNYSKVEEDKVSIWQGKESDYEDKALGLAVLVGDVPDEYFSNYDLTKLTGTPADAWIFGNTTDEESARARKSGHRKPEEVA
jgi:hypothetical protein